MNGIYAGVWDLLHPGHLLALQWARERCDHLTAALNIDPTVDNPKKRKPIESKADRVERLKACRYVDNILCYTGEKALEVVYQQGNYEVAFISEEHKVAYTETHGIEVVFVPRNTGHSSTQLIRKIREVYICNDRISYTEFKERFKS